MSNFFMGVLEGTAGHLLGERIQKYIRDLEQVPEDPRNLSPDEMQKRQYDVSCQIRDILLYGVVGVESSIKNRMVQPLTLQPLDISNVRTEYQGRKHQNMWCNASFALFFDGPGMNGSKNTVQGWNSLDFPPGTRIGVAPGNPPGTPNFGAQQSVVIEYADYSHGVSM